MKKLIYFLLFVFILSSVNGAIVHTLIYADDFAAGTINSTFWNTSTSCSAATNALVCGGNNVWITSNNLTELNFNESADYNFTLTLTAESSNRECLGFQDDEPLFASETSASSCRGTGDLGTDDRFNFYNVGSASETFYVPQDTGTNIDVLTAGSIINYIRNSTGYFIFSDGVLRKSTTNSIVNLLEFFTHGDYETDQGGATQTIDDIFFYQVDIVADPPAPSTTNTSIFVGNFNLSTIQFGTNSFFDAFFVEFNSTLEANYSLVNSFNILKVSGGSSNDVFGRILVDDVEITTELLRTVSTTGDEGSTGFLPNKFNLEGGNHNITIQFRRTTGGTIEINDIDFNIIEFLSTDDLSIHSQLNTFNFSHDQLPFERKITYEVQTENLDLFILNKMNIFSDIPSVVAYYFSDLDADVNGSLDARSITTDIGSVGNVNLFNETSGNISIVARIDGGEATVNTTLINIVMGDSSGSFVDSFRVSDPATTVDLFRILSTGNTLLITGNKTIVSGNSLFIGASVSFNSTTGEQTPVFTLNSTNTTCSSKKERFMTGSGNIGDVYLFLFCDNLSVGSEYIFDLFVDVAVGEDLDILDEVMAGFDATQLDTTIVAQDISFNISTDLVNNTENFNADSIAINYTIDFGIDNAFDNANCSLFVDDILNETQNERNESVLYTFDFTVPVVESNLAFEIICLNVETTNTTGQFFYNTDKIAPILISTFVNNSQIILGNEVSFTVNITDPNLFAYNISWFDINDVLLLNRFVQNLTVVSVVNTTSRVTTIEANNFTIRVEAWDSHTKIDIPDYNWYKYSLDIGGTMYKGISFANNKLNISSSDYSKINEFSLYKTNDRYKMIFNFSVINTSIDLYLDSKKEMIYLPDSTYDGHFVIGNKHWIDFESRDVSNLQVTYLTNNNVWRIRFTPNKEIVEFSSIGDLNKITSVWFYDVISASTETILNTTGIEDSIDRLEEGIQLFAFIIFAITFFIFGIMSRLYFISGFGGIGFILVGINFVNRLPTDDSLYNLWMSIIFLSLGIFLFLGFSMMSIVIWNKSGKDRFHPDY